mgnify:CR=1 FL=1
MIKIPKNNSAVSVHKYQLPSSIINLGLCKSADRPRFILKSIIIKLLIIQVLIQNLTGLPAKVHKVERKKENKNAPLLFNLAELQNECSKLFKISPDETLKITQELYEKKLVTYPRTDARVLSTAVAKEIYKNIGGLRNFGPLAGIASEIMEQK